MQTPRVTYDERARDLLKAMDIADDVRAAIPDASLTAAQQRLDAEFLNQLRESIRNPEPPFRNRASLRYLEEEFFTYWNEAIGRDVEEFWRRIAESGLPFERKDHVRAILAARKIANRIQYEAVQDGVVLWEQEGRITAEQAAALKGYVGAYELRRRGTSRQ
jgi:hypothetical protein